MKTPDEWRLLEYLDGRLDERERTEVEAYLAEHPEVRRAMGEHREVWDLLDDAFDDGAIATSDAFRRATVERARVDVGAASPRARSTRARSTVARARVDVGAASPWGEPGVWRRGVALAAAAALVVSVTATWMSDSRSRYVVSDAERPVIGHLDLLRHLDFLEEHGDALDVVAAWQQNRALDGEVALGDDR